MATFTGWIFSRNLINWDTMESVYFGQTGNVVKSNFLSVAVVIWLMYVLKLMLLFTIVDLSLWYPKTLFFVWIVLLIPLGIEIFSIAAIANCIGNQIEHNSLQRIFIGICIQHMIGYVNFHFKIFL